MLVGLFAARAHRQLIAVAFVAAAFLAMQTWILYTQTNSNGLRWQGRYGLAIYMGLPFVFMSRRPQVQRARCKYWSLSSPPSNGSRCTGDCAAGPSAPTAPSCIHSGRTGSRRVPSVLILAVAAIGAWLIVAGVRACLAQVDHEG